MNKLIDILDVCLQELENGVEVETILANYPDYVEELRPILLASVNARQRAASPPSPDVVRRNRAKLLQRAATLREEQRPLFTWSQTSRRLVVAFTLLALFFLSGTRLVRASSNSLPGDNLYTVKRSWEDVRLFFTFNEEQREGLEVEYENERIGELQELFAEGRSANVQFSGVVSNQNGNLWRVASVSVNVSAQTKLPNQPVHVGSAVLVTGRTETGASVIADQIELLTAGVVVPQLDDSGEQEIEAELPTATPRVNSTTATSKSVTVTPESDSEATNPPSFIVTPGLESFQGTLKSITKDVWQVDNVAVNVQDAQIMGTPFVGASVKVQGYYKSNGTFIGTTIRVLSTYYNSDSNTNNNNDESVGTSSSSNNNTNDNSSDDSHDDNSNDNNTNDH